MWWIGIIYFMTHVWLLLNRGIFWDDWIWYNNPEAQAKSAVEIGAMIWVPFTSFFYNGHVFGARMSVFLSWATSSYLVYFIFSKLLSTKAGFFISLFFITLPFMVVGRSTLCTMTYSWCVMFFLLGIWIFLNFYPRKKSWFAVFPFFLSFPTNSLLVLYFFILGLWGLHLMYKKQMNLKSIFPVFLLTATAFVFWGIKSFFYKPSGMFQTYNQFNISSYLVNFQYNLKKSYIDLTYPLLGYFKEEIQLRSLDTLFLILIFWLLVFVWRSRLNRRSVSPQLWFSWLFILVAPLIAAFPYQLVGKYANFSDWESRHLLLTLMIAPPIYFLTVNYLSKIFKLRVEVLCWFMVTFFSLITIRFYLGMQTIEMYQQGLISYWKKNILTETPQQNISFEDRLVRPAGIEVSFRFYDHSGMIYQTNKMQKTLVLTSQEQNAFYHSEEWREELVSFLDRYKLSQANVALPFKKKIVVSNSVQPSSWQAMRHIYKSWLERDRTQDWAYEQIHIQESL